MTVRAAADSAITITGQFGSRDVRLGEGVVGVQADLEQIAGDQNQLHVLPKGTPLGGQTGDGRSRTSHPLTGTRFTLKTGENTVVIDSFKEHVSRIQVLNPNWAPIVDIFK